MLITGIADNSYYGSMPGAFAARSPAMQTTFRNPVMQNPGVNNPAPQNPIQQGSPPLRNYTGYNNPAIVMWSGDGDTVELTRPFYPAAVTPATDYPIIIAGSPAAGTPMPNQGILPNPAAPQGAPSAFTAAPEANNELIPEMPGSGLLDSLKPEGECQTCANRKYVDGSDDPSVSYQTPTNISPNMAAAAVAAHEQEHVRNEQANAQREDRQVVNQSVTLHFDTCPECGKSYVSGGTTRTTTVGKSSNSENMAKTQQNQPSGETQ